ncbi:hypothetical protein L6164_004526, partial [Bauhinia variegata]
LWLTLCLATNSCTWLNSAVFITNMRNFPLSRGTVSGILKGYVGISAAVYTLIYSVLLKGSTSGLLLFLTFGIPVLCVALMYFVQPCTPSGEDSAVHVHFIFTQATSVLLAVFLVGATLLNDLVSISDAVSYSFIAIMIILMMTPLAIPAKMTLFPANSRKNRPWDGSSDQLVSGDDDSTQNDPLLMPSSSDLSLGSFYENEDASYEYIQILLAEGEGAVRKKRRPKRGEDFKFGEAIVKADFWLVIVCFFLGVGTGITVINNLAQIGIAFGVENTSILLSVFSFCNFVGRLGGGAVSEHFVRSKTLPRTFWITCTQVIMVVAFILYAFALNGTLYVSTALVGICLGAQYSVMMPTVSELFGLKHFGVISSVMLLGSPIGATLFSALLAGYVYDAEAAKQGSSTCYGGSCFGLTFLVLAGACGLGSILSVVLTIRICPVYQMLYAGGSFRLPQTSNE